MFFYVQSLVDSAYLSLNSIRLALVSSISPPTNARGLLGTLMLLVILSCATVLWILAFFLLPTLLAFAWTVLQPYRLWVFLRSRIAGMNFSS